MADKAATKSVSATIAKAHYDALEEYRWGARKNMSQVIDQAVAEFIAKHGIPVPGNTAPASEKK